MNNQSQNYPYDFEDDVDYSRLEDMWELTLTKYRSDIDYTEEICLTFYDEKFAKREKRTYEQSGWHVELVKVN